MSTKPDTYDPLRAKTKVALSVAVSFVFGLGLASQLGFTARAFPAPYIETAPQIPAAAVQPALDLSEAFVNIAEAVTPSVVRIEARRQARAEPESDALRRFFRDPGQEQQGLPPVRTSGGSGFVVSTDGYVLTNNHVIEDAEAITVNMQDGRSYPAELVGADPTTDVAVVKVEAEALQAISLASSSDVRVGEWVLAVGNPGLGAGTSLPYTVTAGIVSALGRGLQLLANDLLQDPRREELIGFAIEDFIQTDAVINPGNSGGPMVNLQGQVIGINSAIASSTGFYQGYGFAIPIDLAQRVMEDLIAYGHVRRAYLGIRMQNVVPEDAEVFGLPEIAGALVQEVTEDTPASRADLRAYDVVTAVDGEKVRTSNELQHKIALKAPGDRITVTIFRDGSARDVSVRLEQAPLNNEVAEAPTPRPRTADKIGIEVRDITPEIARSLGLDGPGGVVVSSVQPGGPAARRSLQPGSVIHEINGDPIQSTDDVDQAFRGVEAGQVVSLVVEFQGVTSLTNVRVPR